MNVLALIKKSSLALFVLANFSNVFADSIYLGQPGYGGTGCPGGSASVTLSPDQKSLSIIFDEYMAEAGRSLGKTIDRKTCNIAIPVHVPNGLSVSIIDVDYRGFVSLPSQAYARFTAEYFFAGRSGPQFTKMFRGIMDSDFTLSSTLAVGALVWSECGKDVNLRVNTSMLLKNSNRRDDALATVDSADFNAGLIYHLKFRRCR